MEPQLHEIDPKTLHAWIEAGEVLLVDVREQEEYEEAHLEHASLIPTSNFNADAVPHHPPKKTVFYCRVGHRSALAAIKWAETRGVDDAYHLKGGINAWKEEQLHGLHSL